MKSHYRNADCGHRGFHPRVTSLPDEVTCLSCLKLRTPLMLSEWRRRATGAGSGPTEMDKLDPRPVEEDG